MHVSIKQICLRNFNLRKLVVDGNAATVRCCKRAAERRQYLTPGQGREGAVVGTGHRERWTHSLLVFLKNSFIKHFNAAGPTEHQQLIELYCYLHPSRMFTNKIWKVRPVFLVSSLYFLTATNVTHHDKSRNKSPQK